MSSPPSFLWEATIAALVAERDAEFDPPPFDPVVAELLGPSGAPATPHRRLLERINGGYLFQRALHLFGACERPAWHSLAAWNAPATWRDAYGPLTDGLIFFAEDAFGDQYAYSRRPGEPSAEVLRFESELGRAHAVAPTFAAWIDGLLLQPSSLLPIDVIAAQAAEGKRLQPGNQLFAWPPLFSLEAAEGVTVGHVDALEAMRFRGDLASKISGLPTGTQVKITLP